MLWKLLFLAMLWTLTRVVLKLEYPWRAVSMLKLLISWQPKKPGHQQPRYSWRRISRSLSSTRSCADLTWRNDRNANWSNQYVLSIPVTSWARWRLKSQASRWFAQPFGQAQIKENIKALRYWPFVSGIHRCPVNSPHKGPVTRKMFPFDNIIIINFNIKVINVLYTGGSWWPSTPATHPFHPNNRFFTIINNYWWS